MRRLPYLIALATLFTALAVAPAAGFRVPEDQRVKNVAPGYCGWAALETLAKSRAPLYPDDPNYKKLLTLMDRRRAAEGEVFTQVLPSGRVAAVRMDPGATYPAVVRRELTALGVRYRESPAGTKDFAFVKRACDDGFGAMVAVANAPPVTKEGHALAVTEVSDAPEAFVASDGTVTTDVAVYYYDSNNVGGVFRASKTWFVAAMTGWAVVPEPQGARVAPAVAPVAPVALIP